MAHTPRGIEQIVDEQVRRWEASKRARLVSDRPHPASVVTISREAGARGHELGKAVAERLGFQLWDQQLVVAMAEGGTASLALLSAIDERERNAVSERVAVFGSHRGPVDSYMDELVKLVHTLAERGEAVIVGRGAQFILGPRNSVSARAIAPLEDRIARRMNRDGLELAEAKRRIERVDKERAAFHREHFGRTGTEVETYDVVVNTSTLGIEAAADALVIAYRAKIDRLDRMTSATHAELVG